MLQISVRIRLWVSLICPLVTAFQSNIRFHEFQSCISSCSSWTIIAGTRTFLIVASVPWPSVLNPTYYIHHSAASNPSQCRSTFHFSVPTTMAKITGVKTRWNKCSAVSTVAPSFSLHGRANGTVCHSQKYNNVKSNRFTWLISDLYHYKPVTKHATAEARRCSCIVPRMVATLILSAGWPNAAWHDWGCICYFIPHQKSAQ